tara:strand:- start:8319 stop:11981 length:3663 start_codon:yes stop_codon:yes gene_type:complete
MDAPAHNPFDLSGIEGFDEAAPATHPDPGMPADPTVLERNLVALCARNRGLAERLRHAQPHPASGEALVFEPGADGLLSATLGGRRLSSARRGREEARRLAEGVDPSEVASACVIGFGLGHHVRALHERMGTKSCVICLETDLGLLRAVLERVDHSAWLALGRCVIATDPEDAAGLTRQLKGLDGLLAIGVKIVEHPASKARLAEAGTAFGRTVSEVVRCTRTHVVTTLVHAPVTLRNMLMNADRYATSAGITALKDACKGSPAVTVAAGPSLQKNLALLAEPGVRDRVVIIAAQTVLRPMLAAGVKPHFVTALDHHELSGRFYEGLTPDDVRGVRLVVEPKANPAILESFPGEILCTEEPILDDLIGPDLARPMGAIKPGSTVAHLSYALARYIGCDPVIMIGQDLAFTDHQYYAANAAIHRVWQGEINPERTLEMLEWERVARMRANLRRVPDHKGRPIYTDEQMATYLAQFEAEFQADTQAGLVVIDATEGGARKRHAAVMTLADALAAHANKPRPPLPDTVSDARPIDAVRERLRAHLARVRAQAGEIARQSDRAARNLTQVVACAADARRADRLIREVHKSRDIVHAAQPGFRLVEFINQTGVLNRFKADRIIGLNDDADAATQRRLLAERDVKNVGWIGDAARELDRRVGVAVAVLDGQRAKATREEPAPDPRANAAGLRNPELFVLCDPDYAGLGIRRDLAEPVWQGRDALALTLERVLRCRSVRTVRLLTPEPERTAALVERAGFSGRVRIEPVDRARWRARTEAVGVARAGAADCWRGGVGQTTVYDEQLDPIILASVMDAHGVDACAVVGADWSLTDPALIDALVQRHADAPERHQLAFTQSVPGLGALVLGRAAVESLETLANLNSPLGTVGGLLGYLPVKPQADPIATPLCLKVDPCVRDAGVRAVADSAPGRALIAGAMDRLGERAADSSAVQSARALAGVRPFRSPRTLVLELCPGRLVSGPFNRAGPIPGERAPLSIAHARELIQEHTRHREDAVVVLDGPGDPLMHPDALDVVRLADECGAACVHLRTDLLREGLTAEAIIDSGLGVLSVDLLADTPATYSRLTGTDRHTSVARRMGAIADARALAAGLPAQWIVPRILKCDATLEEIEPFYDRWIMTLGAAVIDPLPAWSADPIIPLPVPAARLTQLSREVVRVRCDGAVCDDTWRAVAGVNAITSGLSEAVRAVRERTAGRDRVREGAGAAA